MSRRPTAQAEPASIIPTARPRVGWMVLPNAMLNAFEFHFAISVSGRCSNVMARVVLNPAEAERLARQILADLDGLSEQVAKMQAAVGGAP
jgi:hypothetical protein